MAVTLYSPKYKLRWCFEYKNGSIKYGMWSHSGPKGDLHTKAWANNKDIAYALIERKDNNAAIKQIVRCDHTRFLNFQWLTNGCSINPLKIKGNVTPLTWIVGLKMMTTDCEIDCFGDGRIVPSDLKNKNIHFKTFGK